jgi:type III secretion system FlhB-like substrate exporter
VAGICDLVASGDVWQEEKIKTAGRDASDPVRKTAGLETSVPLEEEPAGCRRSDKRESHGTPPSLVASGDVWQEEKIKTAGLETSVPLEEEPAGCQRSDKRESHGTPPFLVASGDVWQEEKIKTAGLETSVPLRRRAGRMPAIR